MDVSLPDAAATDALGTRIAARMRAGDTLFLIGPLGAGKTSLARAIIAAWTGGGEEAPSPTFTLVQTYEGARGVLLHADLYRLKNAAEAEEIGLIDAFGADACLVEWPDRLGAFAPVDRLEIALAFAGAGRSASITGFGAWRERADGL